MHISNSEMTFAVVRELLPSFFLISYIGGLAHKTSKQTLLKKKRITLFNKIRQYNIEIFDKNILSCIGQDKSKLKKIKTKIKII